MLIIKNYPDTHSTGNGPVQKDEVGESTRHKWVKQLDKTLVDSITDGSFTWLSRTSV